MLTLIAANLLKGMLRRTPPVDNPFGNVFLTSEFLARLAVWARKTNAINVGYDPAPPPDMNERATPSSSGRGLGSPHGSSMSSMMLDFPDPDPEPHFY